MTLKLDVKVLNKELFLCHALCCIPNKTYVAWSVVKSLGHKSYAVSQSLPLLHITYSHSLFFYASIIRVNVIRWRQLLKVSNKSIITYASRIPNSESWTVFVQFAKTFASTDTFLSVYVKLCALCFIICFSQRETFFKRWGFTKICNIIAKFGNLLMAYKRFVFVNRKCKTCLGTYISWQMSKLFRQDV